MALALDTGSHSDDVMVDINTTPLIDVMLVLLIMLIITIPIQLHSINMNMPVGTPPPVVQPEVVRITIDDHGVVAWNGEALADGNALQARLQAAAAQSVAPELHIRPDKKVPYRVVAGVMAAVQRTGLNKVALVGGEQFI